MFASAVAVLPARVARAAPSVTLTPNTDLVDRQVVTVRGEGFPSGRVAVRQCGGTWPQCRAPIELTTDTGSFEVSIELWSVFFVDELIDCRPVSGSCWLNVAGEYVALDFDPNAPHAPWPTVTTDTGDGLVQDRELVEATATGFPDLPGEAWMMLYWCTPGATRCVTVGRSQHVDSAGRAQRRFQAELWKFGEGCVGMPCELRASIGDPEDPTVTAVAPLSFEPGARENQAEIEVVPSAGLTDGQRVRVTVRWLLYCNIYFGHDCPDAGFVRVCALSEWLCSDVLGEVPRLDNQAGFTLEVPVPATFVEPTWAPGGGSQYDCRLQPCRLFAASVQQPTDGGPPGVSAPISFLPVLIAAPSFTG